MSGNRPGDHRGGGAFGRRAVWSALLVLGVALSAAGCMAPGSAPAAAPSGAWRLLPPGLGGLRAKAEHEALRKKVEADSFPTAAQAGL